MAYFIMTDCIVHAVTTENCNRSPRPLKKIGTHSIGLGVFQFRASEYVLQAASRWAKRLPDYRLWCRLLFLADC